MMPIEIPANPFGSHKFTYTPGSILPSGASQTELDSTTSSYYDTWKSNYLVAGCGADRYYVETKTEAGNLTVSEGHGYGMMLAAIMAGYDADAQKEFDGLYWFFRDHPSAISPDLMSWYQDASCNNAMGQDSASDGDIDIAFALLLADKQWGSCGPINYKAEALKVIDAIGKHELDTTKAYVLLGDWADPSSPKFYNSTRSSDFVVDHFRSYAAATGNASWTGLVDKTHGIIASMQMQHSPTAGLLPDFILSPLASPTPAGANFLEGPNDGAYDYNACRDPWRLATDFLVSGDDRARQEISKMTTWIKGKAAGDPTKIRAGYQLNGTASNGSNYLTMAFAAPFGPAAMVDATHQAWLDAIWTTTVAMAPEGYYEDTIKLFSMIVMSSNWWAPEARPVVCNAGP
jgi:endo-1,4-beta-D-glucanase Y